MRAPTDLQPAHFSALLLFTAWLADDRAADRQPKVVLLLGETRGITPETVTTNEALTLKVNGYGNR